MKKIVLISISALLVLALGISVFAISTTSSNPTTASSCSTLCEKGCNCSETGICTCVDCKACKDTNCCKDGKCEKALSKSNSNCSMTKKGCCK